MFGDFVIFQAIKDDGFHHCGNGGGVSVQILSILLIIEPSGFANELDVNCEWKRSQRWHYKVLVDWIILGDRIPNFRRPILNEFLIDFLKCISHLGNTKTSQGWYVHMLDFCFVFH